MFPKRDDILSKRLSSEFVRSKSMTTSWGNIMSMYQSLMGLRAFYPGNTMDNNFWVYDKSGQDRHLAPYTTPVDTNIHYFNGSTPVTSKCDLYRPHEPGIDLIGTDVEVNPPDRGITIGSWVWSDLPPGMNYEGIIVKGTAKTFPVLNQYYLIRNGAAFGAAEFGVGDGVTEEYITGSAIVQGKPNFVVGRYSTWNRTIAIFSYASFQDDIRKDEISLPVGFGTVYSSTTKDLCLQSIDHTRNLFGWTALSFVCASALPDHVIRSLFAHTRAYFGELRI